MKIFYILSFVTSLLLVGIAAMIYRKTDEKKKDMTLKVLGGIYLVLFFSRFLIYDGVYNLHKSEETLFLLSRWFYHAVLLILPMAAFSKYKIYRKLAVYFAIPIIILSIVYMQKSIGYFLDYKDFWNTSLEVYSRRAVEFAMKVPDALRHIQYTLELSFALLISLYILIVSKTSLKFISRKELERFLIAIPCILFIMIPHYFVNATLGQSSLAIASFKAVSILQVTTYMMIIVMHIALKKYSYDAKYSIMCALALSVLIQFCTRYVEGYTIRSIPLQLCNLGCFLLVLCLITKWKSLFYFTFFINVTGALIALSVPNIESTVFSSDFFHYYHEHIFVFIVPILCITLGLYTRPDTKNIKTSLGFFTVYFLVCLILGTWFMNYDTGVNYFYLIQDTIARFIPIFALLRRTIVSFNLGSLKFTFYPLYQLGLYVSFLACLTILFVIYKKLDSLFDEYRIISRKNKQIWLESNNVAALKTDRIIKLSFTVFAISISSICLLVLFLL